MKIYVLCCYILSTADVILALVFGVPEKYTSDCFVIVGSGPSLSY